MLLFATILNISEGKWYNQLDTQINISLTHKLIYPPSHEIKFLFHFCAECLCVLIIAASMLAFSFSSLVTALQMRLLRIQFHCY